jgi:hypothetical protein
MQLRQIMRKFLAAAALLALLLAGVPTLADAFSPPDLPACCNSIYCPMHHRQASDSQKHKGNCAAMCNFNGNDCSMSACDMSPNPVAQLAPFVLASPMAIRNQAIEEPAPALAPGFVFSHLRGPSIPPPRTFPS